MKVVVGFWGWCLVLVLVLVLLTSASHTHAQTSLLPPTITSTSPDSRETDSDSITASSITQSGAAITSVSKHQAGAVTSSTESPLDTPLDSSTTQSHTFSSPPASTSLGGTPSVLSSTEPPLVPLTTASAPTATGGSQGITGRHQETPSQLTVAGEGLKASVRRSLDPLLAGLLSVFIVTTAVIFVVLFLKFRHQNSNPEFHRLQDLPMDDLMEDTPLSRYTY